MKQLLIFVVLVSTVLCQNLRGAFPDNYADVAKLLVDTALTQTDFEPFEELCDTFGPRYRGTPNLDNALSFISSRMESQFDLVQKEPVYNITNWIRGTETLTLLTPRRASMSILGLGLSVGGDITAEVFVVSSFDDLRANASKANGKIVLFNAPFVTYGQTVIYRVIGASEAAKVGAVAALVRSVTPFSLYTPHTGGMAYTKGVPQIPVASVTIEDSEMMARMQARGQKITARLQMSAHIGTPVTSYNILADIVGRESPDEIVLIGGHSDSWDVGQGAIDDGGGLFTSWEAARLISSLIDSGDLPRPRRTIRVIHWVDEELGQRGAATYAQDHIQDLKNHVIAIESDSGNFNPTGFGFSGTPEATAIMKQIGTLLSSIGTGNITTGGEDTDNGFLGGYGVPSGSLVSTGFGNANNAYYFYFHHTNADSITHINRDGFRRSVAAFAVMSYVLADMEDRLPWGIPNPPPSRPLQNNGANSIIPNEASR